MVGEVRFGVWVVGFGALQGVVGEALGVFGRWRAMGARE